MAERSGRGAGPEEGPRAAEAEPRLDPRFCRFRIERRRSRIHRWGLFAVEPIPARRRVIEYTGEKIDAEEVERRGGRRHVYIFSLNDRWALDGAIGGSGAQLINHSCEPNLSATIAGSRIFLTSLRRIERGEELTLDYHLDETDREIACKCGAKRCRGTVNHLKKKRGRGA